MASSTVPITAKPEAFMASAISSTSVVSGPERQGGDALEVVDPLGEPEPHVLVGLLLGVGDVDRADESPLAAVDRGAELGRPLLHDGPVRAEHVEAALVGGADRQQRCAEAPGQAGTRGRHLGGDRDLEARVGVRAAAAAGRPCSVNQSVWRVTGFSPSSSSRMASNASSIMSRCRATSMPIMKASDGSAPGPTPNMTRPRVRWSSSTIRSASISGLVVGERADAGAEPDVLGSAARRRR